MLGQKIVALLIMVIPAAIAVYGIKVMRDVIYMSFIPDTGFQWGRFLFGLALFLIPAFFVGGFILHHERKRNRVQPRFMVPEDEEDDNE